jgi:hypothetical protein
MATYRPGLATCGGTPFPTGGETAEFGDALKGGG